MKFKFSIFGIIALICALVLFCGIASPVSASANSGPSHWSGNTVSGAYFTGESCPLLVERETLIFDIPEVNFDYGAEEEYISYEGRVTADYAFKNPTDDFISTTLAFPFGAYPMYSESPNIPGKYGVKINGENTNVQLRHSWCIYGSAFDFSIEVAKLCDEYKTDDFFYPEMPVYKYSYKINTAVKGGVYCSAEINLNDSAIRIGASGSLAVKKSIATVSSYFGNDVNGEILSFGGELDFSAISWKFYTESDFLIFTSKKKIDGSAELVSTEVLSFKNYATAARRNGGEISDADYYNGAIDYLNYYYPHGALPVSMNNFTASSFMRWFVYSLSFAPHENVQNTVVAPVYPTIYLNYAPFKYGIQYLLSPAKGWSGFGEIELIINTPYLIIDCDFNLEKTENGYRGVIDKLPDGELEFQLCETLTPVNTRKGYGYGLVIFFFGPLIIAVIAFIIFVIIKLVKRSKNARRS